MAAAAGLGVLQSLQLVSTASNTSLQLALTATTAVCQTKALQALRSCVNQQESGSNPGILTTLQGWRMQSL
jgi:hypothetical protein